MISIFLSISIDALLLLMHIHPVIAFSRSETLHSSRIAYCSSRFAYDRLRTRTVPGQRPKVVSRSKAALLMSEGYNDVSSEESAAEPDKQPEGRPESGWVTNFKYLLPASFRSKPSFETDVDVSTFNPNSRDDSDPIFLEASTFNEQREEECAVEDDGVIDVECYVEEVRDEKNVTVAEIENDGLDAEVEQLEPISKPRNWFMRLFRSGAASEMQPTSFNETLNETDQNDQDDVSMDATDDTTNATSTKQEQKRKRHNKPIFHNLETNDIDSTMQSKQRKWSRRRKRAVMLVQTLKNACFLFVVTFLAGNLMNQFVDLDEDGSFEVHFGKALSSSPASSNVEKSVSVDWAGRIDKRRTTVRPRLISSTEHKPLGLVSQAVQKVGPAVVRVETETDVLDSDTTNSNGEEDRGDIFDGIPEAPPQSGDKMIDFGQGSGIIIRINDEFHILTNAHVIDGASRINVLLTDGRRYKAELTGSDDIMDVAVLKILPEDFAQGSSDLVSDLPVADLGDSDRLEVGTFVTAIGSPGGLDNSCTIGIVSGLKRCPKAVGIPDKAGVLQYIQTDAAINVGNSGGPLVDVESGEIIGINTCIRANMEGTSFAIPINKVMGILDDLYEGRHITHGYLGVQMSTINPTLARYHNQLQAQNNGAVLPEKDGVMIEKVFKKSPAEIGGLKKFDFVSAIDGQKVTNAEDAHLIIDQATIGEDLSLTIIRGDDEIVVQVKPEDLSVRLKQLREERMKKKKTKA